MGTRVPSASISPTDINRSARRPPELIPAGARKLARTQRSARGSAGRATSPGGRDPLRALQIIQRIFARNGGRRKVRPSACLVAAGGGKGSDPAAPIRSGRSQTMPSRRPRADQSQRDRAARRAGKCRGRTWPRSAKAPKIEIVLLACPVSIPKDIGAIIFRDDVHDAPPDSPLRTAAACAGSRRASRRNGTGGSDRASP